MTQYNTLRPYKFDRLLCVNVEKSWYECDLFAEKKKKDVDWIYLLQKMIQNRHMALLYKLKNDRSLPF